MGLEEIYLSSCTGSVGSTSPPLSWSGPQSRLKMGRSCASGNQGWKAYLMLREDITMRATRKTLMDVHTFGSKRDMVEATRKTSRTARTNHHSFHWDLHAERVSKLSGSLRQFTTGEHQTAWELFNGFITENTSLSTKCLRRNNIFPLQSCRTSKLQQHDGQGLLTASQGQPRHC